MPPLPAAVEVAAYRIVQEALTNVSRHAEAQTCRISLRSNGHVEIEVADDGKHNLTSYRRIIFEPTGKDAATP